MILSEKTLQGFPLYGSIWSFFTSHARMILSENVASEYKDVTRKLRKESGTDVECSGLSL